MTCHLWYRFILCSGNGTWLAVFRYRSGELCLNAASIKLCALGGASETIRLDLRLTCLIHIIPTHSANIPVDRLILRLALNFQCPSVSFAMPECAGCASCRSKKGHQSFEMAVRPKTPQEEGNLMLPRKIGRAITKFVAMVVGGGG